MIRNDREALDPRHRRGIEDEFMIAAIALFGFGAATALASLSLPIGTLRAPGSGFFPLVLGLVLAALSVAQGVTLYRAQLERARSEPLSPAAPASPTLGDDTRRVLLFLGAAAGAVALLPLLGYAFASLVLMLSLLRILGLVSWPLVAAISAATALACYLVFVRVLGIPLPSGLPGF
jgi:putative tricarboxylic transport membrane protein